MRKWNGWGLFGIGLVCATQLGACGSNNQVQICDNSALTFGCKSGRCEVRSNADPLPMGVNLIVNEIPITADLTGDAIGPSLCSLSLSSGTEQISGLTLTITVDNPPDANAILFQHVSTNYSTLVSTSQPGTLAVVGVVSAPGDYGPTERPQAWDIEGYAGQDVLSSGDQASLLRNLSSQHFATAFYDGTNLYVANGSRILIYNGIPADPSVLPNVVLGEPDLNTLLTGTSSSLMGSGAVWGLWSDGTRLVASNGGRVLIWNQVPTQSFTPADIVLGQADFVTNTNNSGGLSAQSVSMATAIDSDGTRLAVADTLNNRVLIWNAFPSLVGQPADFVVGQPNFTSGAIDGGAIPMYQPWGVLFNTTGMFIGAQYNPGLVHLQPVTANNPSSDFTAVPDYYEIETPNAMYAPAAVVKTTNGGLACRDGLYLQRVAMFRTIPAAPANIDFILGQPDPIHVVKSQISAAAVQTNSQEEGLGGGAALLVPDGNRLLVYNTPPTYNFAPANQVIGQAGFTTNGRVDYRAISASTVAGPADVAVGSGMVAVADRGNNRVLLFKQSDLQANNFTASVVVGQPDMLSYVPDLDQQTPSASRLSGPSGVALDGTHLIVADGENHRVLIWNSVPTANGVAADVVLGQSDFVGHAPNKGRGDSNNDGFCDTGADGLFYPTGVASDGTHLFVADRMNSRVLVWNTFPSTNGQPADAVIGQPDFVTSNANRGTGPYGVVAANGLNLPTGVTLVGTTLWVADTENNRVVRWDNATTTPAPGAFVGQTSGTVVSNPNYEQPTQTNIGFPQSQPTTSVSVLRPRSVAIAGSRLLVSETDSNRVHFFDSTQLTPLGELGQTNDITGTPDTNGVSAATLSSPLGIATDGTTVWVADAGNHRVLGYVASTLATGVSASSVVGQSSALTSGFNQSSSAAGSVTSNPRGLALQNGQLYIADTNNNRVLVMKTPVASGDIPVNVYGQPDDLLALANSGGPPTARSLNQPRGVFADAKYVLVSDTGNNRVLVFDPTSTAPDASLVLGQASFTAASANAGGASLSTLQQPTAAFTDDTSLFVADTGNHRVLVWNQFPTTNGQPADLVLGQSAAGNILSNLGVPAAAPNSMSFPAAIEEINGVLLVADSGNNRVLMFSTIPTASGAAADGVLGQPNLTSRTAAAVTDDLTHLAGPVAMAFDGTNLYVTDRDMARVVAYGVGTLQSSSPGLADFGLSGGLSLKAPGGVAVERTPYFTSRVYVADTGDNQLTLLGSVDRLATP